MTASDNTRVPNYADVMRMDGRGCIVVGAGRGMGRQIAHALSQQGARVLCVDVDATRAKEVAEEIGEVDCVADATVAADVARFVSVAKQEFGRVHAVADIVGMARYARLIDMPEEDWDWCHDMVLRHAYHVVKYAGRQLAEDGGGSIAFVASISGVSSAPFHGAYGAAKAGLISLVRTAAVELKPAEVRVNAVTPGNTASPRIAAQQGTTPDELATGSLSAHGATSDIAAALLFFCSDLSKHITGQNLAVDGGDLVKYPHDIPAPPLAAGKAMGDDARL